MTQIILGPATQNMVGRQAYVCGTRGLIQARVVTQEAADRRARRESQIRTRAWSHSRQPLRTAPCC